MRTEVGVEVPSGSGASNPYGIEDDGVGLSVDEDRTTTGLETACSRCLELLTPVRRLLYEGRPQLGVLVQ